MDLKSKIKKELLDDYERLDRKLSIKSFDKDANVELIRMGNEFLRDFFFDDKKNLVEIPLNATKIIFEMLKMTKNEQFQSSKNIVQASLFDDEFKTVDNTFAKFVIPTRRISLDYALVRDALTFLTIHKMGWQKSKNSKGKNVWTFGGLISTPSMNEKGKFSFLVSSYWLEKILSIPRYNEIAAKLIDHFNSKKLGFILWVNALPTDGTLISLKTFNQKFQLNYKTCNDLARLFLNPIRKKLNFLGTNSFNYSIEKDKIKIISYYLTPTLEDKKEEFRLRVKQKLHYFKRRYNVPENMLEKWKVLSSGQGGEQFFETMENAHKKWIADCRKSKVKPTSIQGKEFVTIMREYYTANL